MDEIKVRDTQAADMEAVTAIYGEAVVKSCASWEWQAPDKREMERRRKKITASSYPHLVALSDDVVVGFAYAGPFRNRAAYAPVVENSIYVREDMRQTGVGKALLAALIERCERIGYRQMIALIGDDDKSASIALHRSFDFEVRGTLPGVGWKQGHWMELVMMVRQLGDGFSTAPELWDKS